MNRRTLVSRFLAQTAKGDNHRYVLEPRNIVDQGGHQNTVIRDNPGNLALSRQSKAGAVTP